MTRTAPSHFKAGLGFALLAFVLDQLSKWIVIGPLALETRRMIEILPIFRLTWAENCGISLSMFANCTDSTRWTLVAVTAAVAAAVAYWMTKEEKKGDVVALALILGGALGNIVDRVRLGYVADFADLHFGDFRPFMIFNVADACISVGVVLLVARALFLSEKKPEAGVRS
jgi:signal peptidase II